MREDLKLVLEKGNQSNIQSGVPLNKPANRNNRKVRFKCDKCQTDNIPKCEHCYKCLELGHEGKSCPLN